jgi:ABC-type branched-subunit amino acid transport system permease subunit
MRFIFKTRYDQDIQLAKHSGHVWAYSLLLLLLCLAPWLIEEYWLAQLTFVLIYGIVGLGLMVLAGFTGLFSIGHAAFMGVGAYVAAVLSGHCHLSLWFHRRRGLGPLGKRHWRQCRHPCESHLHSGLASQQR